MPHHGEYAEVAVSDQHRGGRKVIDQRFGKHLLTDRLTAIHGAELRSHRQRGGEVVHDVDPHDWPVRLAMLVLCRRIGFNNRRGMGEPDRTAVQQKQAVSQSAFRPHPAELLEAVACHAAGRFFRHLLTRPAVQGCNSSRPFPCNSSLSAVSSVPCGERRCIIIIQVVTRSVKMPRFSTISRSCLSESKKSAGKICPNHSCNCPRCAAAASGAEEPTGRCKVPSTSL